MRQYVPENDLHLQSTAYESSTGFIRLRGGDQEEESNSLDYSLRVLFIPGCYLLTGEILFSLPSQPTMECWIWEGGERRDSL